jgi:hypothetical protein
VSSLLSFQQNNSYKEEKLIFLISIMLHVLGGIQARNLFFQALGNPSTLQAKAGTFSLGNTLLNSQ